MTSFQQTEKIRECLKRVLDTSDESPSLTKQQLQRFSSYHKDKDSYIPLSILQEIVQRYRTVCVRVDDVKPPLKENENDGESLSFEENRANSKAKNLKKKEAPRVPKEIAADLPSFSAIVEGAAVKKEESFIDNVFHLQRQFLVDACASFALAPSLPTHGTQAKLFTHTHTHTHTHINRRCTLSIAHRTRSHTPHTQERERENANEK